MDIDANCPLAGSIRDRPKHLSQKQQVMTLQSHTTPAIADTSMKCMGDPIKTLVTTTRETVPTPLSSGDSWRIGSRTALP
jgi:hypothetical protein